MLTYQGSDMRVISRTALTTNQPFDFVRLAMHLRIPIADGAEAGPMAEAAAREIELYAGLALLDQTIVAESDPAPGAALRIPVNPVQTITSVETVAEDGTVATFTEGWHLREGRLAELRLSAEPAEAIRVTYTAGYGDTVTDVPEDLALAVLDQALRLYDLRGDLADTPPTPSPAFARIAARYRAVRLS